MNASWNMLKHVEIGGMAWQLVLPWHLDFQCPELPRHLATGFGLAAVGSGEGCRPQAAACICYSVSCSRDDYINFIVKPRHCWLLKSQSLDVYTGWNLSKQASTSSQGYPKSLETAKKQTIHLGRAKKAVVFSKQPATWLAGLAACLTFRAMQKWRCHKKRSTQRQGPSFTVCRLYTNSSLTKHIVSGLFDASVLYFVLPSKSDGYMADLQRPNTDNKIE